MMAPAELKMSINRLNQVCWSRNTSKRCRKLNFEGIIV